MDCAKRLLAAGYDEELGGNVEKKTSAQLLHGTCFRSPTKKNKFAMKKGTENEKQMSKRLANHLENKSGWRLKLLREHGFVCDSDDLHSHFFLILLSRVLFFG